MDYVFITGDVTNFQGTLQLNIKRVHKGGRVRMSHRITFRVSEKNIDEMYQELMGYMSQVENPYLQKLIQMYCRKNEAFISAFKSHSAAKTVHHGFVGGLFRHTLGVVKLCDFYVKQYPYLKRDLLFTAALFHDVGKLR